MRYDCIIVGSGPAGLEAAINLKIRKKSFLLLGNKKFSKKVALAPNINNYLGFVNATGKELSNAFQNHLDSMGITITEEMASSVYPMGDYFALATQHNTYEATTIILATGVLNAKAFVGEEEFLGRGVGYCATCDAPLYKGKIVAVVGSSETDIQEANFVAEIAEKVYYIPIGKTDTSLLKENISLLVDKVVEIKGNSKVTTLVLGSSSLAVDGVFILRDTIAPTSLVPGLAVENGFIQVDKHMATNLPGCFAAGDCTGKPHQYIRAAGEGLVAAHSTVDFLDQ